MPDPRILRARQSASRVQAQPKPQIPPSAVPAMPAPARGIAAVKPSGAFNGPDWQPVNGSVASASGSWQYSQLADAPLCQAWIDEAVRLSTLDMEIALSDPSKTFADQIAATAAAWNAIGQAYRAANLPPWNDPKYLQLAQEFDASLYARLRGFIVSMGEKYDQMHLIAPRVKWFGLNEDGTVKAETPQQNEPNCSLLTMPDDDPLVAGKTGADYAHGRVPFRYPCPPGPALVLKNWFTVAWNESEAPALSSNRSWSAYRIVSPLYLYFRYARAIAESLRDAGVGGLIQRIRLGIIEANAKEIVAYSLLDDSNDPDGKLRRASANIANQGQQYCYEEPECQKMLAAAGAVAAAAGAVNAAAGAIIGIAVLALSISPVSIGYVTDYWLRRRPLFQKAFITSVGGRPNHSVDAPPGFDRATVTPQVTVRQTARSESRNKGIVTGGSTALNPTTATPTVWYKQPVVWIGVGTAAAIGTGIAIAMASRSKRR